MRSERVVVLTRSTDDNAAVREELERAGWAVVDAPCVRTEPVEDMTELRAALAQLTASDVLVLTSRAGADAVAAAGVRVPCAVAAVGAATAARARSHGLAVAFVPSRADALTLGRELPLPTGAVVLARSDRAEGDLPRELRARGALVREVVAYRTVPEVGPRAIAALAGTALDGATVMVASPSAVDALVGAVGAAALREARFVAIGPRTAAQVRARVGAHATIAAGTDAGTLADTIRAEEEAIP